MLMSKKQNLKPSNLFCKLKLWHLFSIYLFIYLSIYLFIYLSIYLFIYLSIYLFIYLSIYQGINLDSKGQILVDEVRL